MRDRESLEFVVSEVCICWVQHLGACVDFFFETGFGLWVVRTSGSGFTIGCYIGVILSGSRFFAQYLIFHSGLSMWVVL